MSFIWQWQVSGKQFIHWSDSPFSWRDEKPQESVKRFKSKLFIDNFQLDLQPWLSLTWIHSSVFFQLETVKIIYTFVGFFWLVTASSVSCRSLWLNSFVGSPYLRSLLISRTWGICKEICFPTVESSSCISHFICNFDSIMFVSWVIWGFQEPRCVQRYEDEENLVTLDKYWSSCRAQPRLI